MLFVHPFVGGFEDLDGGNSKPELDDCRRVLTTSRGHVTIAPAVPAVLKNKENCKVYFFIKYEQYVSS